jgi:hypothetical protein
MARVQRCWFICNCIGYKLSKCAIFRFPSVTCVYGSLIGLPLKDRLCRLLALHVILMRRWSRSRSGYRRHGRTYCRIGPVVTDPNRTSSSRRCNLVCFDFGSTVDRMQSMDERQDFGCDPVGVNSKYISTATQARSEWPSLSKTTKTTFS